VFTKEVEQKIEGHSPRELAWRRFKSNKVAIPSLSVALFVVFMVIFAPLIYGLLGIDPEARYMDALDERGEVPGDWNGISWEHPFGVIPGIGYDLLARMLFGARVSFLIALASAVITVLIGLVLGIVGGYFRGRIDGVIGRFTDFLLAFPTFFMIIALSVPFVDRLEKSGVVQGNEARILYFILIFAIFGWPYLSRIIRSQVISIRERDFVLSAEALGASNLRILVKEVLPNVWTPVIVYVSLALPGYLTAEAVFSYLGIGVQPPMPTLGTIIADSTKYMMNNPVYFFIPSLALILLVLTFNLLGDALRDALDPKSES
jgi:ABC-type dipeptide/oligopeptide/nickel transport system permease subunit